MRLCDRQAFFPAVDYAAVTSFRFRHALPRSPIKLRQNSASQPRGLASPILPEITRILARRSTGAILLDTRLLFRPHSPRHRMAAICNRPDAGSRFFLSSPTPPQLDPRPALLHALFADPAPLHQPSTCCTFFCSKFVLSLPRAPSADDSPSNSPIRGFARESMLSAPCPPLGYEQPRLALRPAIASIP